MDNSCSSNFLKKNLRNFGLVFPQNHGPHSYIYTYNIYIYMHTHQGRPLAFARGAKANAPFFWKKISLYLGSIFVKNRALEILWQYIIWSIVHRVHHIFELGPDTHICVFRLQWVKLPIESALRYIFGKYLVAVYWLIYDWALQVRHTGWEYPT